MSKPIDVSLVHDGVRYDASVTRESGGGRNVLVDARCATCRRYRWSHDLRVARWSSSLRRLVRWQVTRAWPRAVRDGLTAAIRCALSEGT